MVVVSRELLRRCIVLVKFERDLVELDQLAEKHPSLAGESNELREYLRKGIRLYTALLELRRREEFSHSPELWDWSKKTEASRPKIERPLGRGL